MERLRDACGGGAGKGEPENEGRREERSLLLLLALTPEKGGGMEEELAKLYFERTDSRVDNSWRESTVGCSFTARKRENSKDT